MPPKYLNTALISIVLTISAYSLREQVQQGKEAAKIQEQVAQVARDSLDVRVRMTSLELSLTNLKLKLAEKGIFLQ